MDLPPSEDSSLKDKNKIFRQNKDDIATYIGSIKLVDKMSDGENDNSTRSKESVKEDKQSHGGETICQLANSIEGDGNELTEIESNLKEFLEKLQCPFSWNLRPPEYEREDILSRTIIKIKETEEDISIHWRSFVMRLLLCYEYYNNNDIESVFNEIQKCEALINAPGIRGYYKEFFQSIRSALLHVISASKAYLYLKKGDLDEVEKILNSICREEDMDSASKAAIWGIKGAVSMEYGYSGTKNAIGYINKALELDEQGEWYFLLGKCLARNRRIDAFNEMPTHEELNALEAAVKISRSPSYMIILAQSYREAAFRAFTFNRNDIEHGIQPVLKEKIANMLKRSAELYKEALEGHGDCSHVNMRCALGFYRLPYPYKDIPLAKQCVEKALQLVPENAMVYHIRGQIFEHECDYDNARSNYIKSGELEGYGALMDLHRMEYNMNKDYNPIPGFEDMLKQFVEKPRWEETTCQMGSYYYFMKNDLPTAYKNYWRKVINENPHSHKLKTHKNTLISYRNPVDIYQILYDEATLALQSNDSKSGEDIKMYREILHLCLDSSPDLVHNSPKQWRKIIMEDSLSNNTSLHTSGRGRRIQAPKRGSGGNQNQKNWRDNSNTSEASGGYGSNARARGSRDSNTRYTRGNSNSSSDSRPGQRFVRKTSDSNWRSN